MSITATVGGTTSNSYVTHLEALDYFATRFVSSSWQSATSESQESALITAAKRIDQEYFIGTRVDEDQALAWPRYGLNDRDGYIISVDEIPQQVKDAQMEFAYSLLESAVTLTENVSGDYEQVSVGPLSVKFRNAASGKLPDQVVRLLTDYLESSGFNYVPVYRS